MSNYALQLQAKQRIRFLYGIGEKHLKNAFLSARNKKGNVGHLFLISLELRLDNVIFRGGLTQTRRQARQFVSHGHISVNGSKVDIPSYKVRLGDVITLNNKLQSNEMVLSSVSNNGSAPWLERDGFSLKIVRLPERSDINSKINESYVVEFYNR